MTEFNQRVSLITRRVVEGGVPVQVTRRGKPVLRLVPEPPDADDPIQSLIALGLATPPVHAPRSWKYEEGKRAVPLSRPLDDLLEESRADVSL